MTNPRDTFDAAMGRFLDAMDAADFFQPGKIYIRNEPYKAPELLDVFQCEHVAPNPRNGELRAFGFANNALLHADGWYSTALTPGNWARGWDEQKEA